MRKSEKRFAYSKDSTDWACYFLKVGSGRTLVHRLIHVKKILDVELHHQALAGGA